MDPTTHYLELCPEPMRFETTDPSHLFFDDSNHQIIALRPSETTGVIVKSNNTSNTISVFCMDDPGNHTKIISIKFSLDNRMVAIQRYGQIIEIFHFDVNRPNLNKLIARKKVSRINNILHGFVWISAREVAFITSGRIEISQVLVEKKLIKEIRSINLPVVWYAWCPFNKSALIASNKGLTMTPVILKPGTITRLSDLELNCGNRSIQQQNVLLTRLYGTGAILILSESINKTYEISVYRLDSIGSSTSARTHVLRLGAASCYEMQIVDNLIAVHHITDKTTILFDITLNNETHEGVQFHFPITQARSIRPTNYKLYSPNWQYFSPNIIADPSIGCLWHLQLDLRALYHLITDPIHLVNILLQRRHGKTVLLSYLIRIMASKYIDTLLPIIIGEVFDKINTLYKTHLENISGACKVFRRPKAWPRVLIDQNDMFNSVFTPFVETEHVGKILMLYLDSLIKNHIPVQHNISRMIIIDLVKSKNLNTLEKLLNGSIIKESIQLAAFLLTISDADLRIGQLSMDMFSRLNAHHQIVKILVEQGKIMRAIRLAIELKATYLLDREKCLEEAAKDDPVLHHSVLVFFEKLSRYDAWINVCHYFP